METSIRKRIWIRNVIIIFLIILLLLTFFSNTILNYTLPEVSVQKPSQGTVNSRISTNASVSANQSISVSINETRTVSAVNVRKGDSVKRGDILFTLTETESEELSNAKDELVQLKFSLTEKENETIEGLAELNEQIAEIERKLSLINLYLTDPEGFEETFDEVTARFEKINTTYQALKKDVDEVTGNLLITNSLLDECKASYPMSAVTQHAGKESALTNYQKAVADLHTLTNLVESYKVERKEFVDEKDALEAQVVNINKTIEANKQLIETYSPILNICDEYTKHYAYDLMREEADAFDKYLKANVAYQNALATYLSESNAKVIEAKNNVEAAKKAYLNYTDGVIYSKEYYDAMTQMKYKEYINSINNYEIYSISYETYKSMRKTCDGLEASNRQSEAQIVEIDKQMKGIDEEIAAIDKEIDEINADLEVRKVEVEKLRGYFSYFVYTETVTELEEEKKLAEAALEPYKEEYESALTDYTFLAKFSEYNEESFVKLTTAYNTELSKLSSQKNSKMLEYNRWEYDVEKLRERVAKQEKNIQVMEEKALSTSVTATIGGVVESVYVVKGETVSAGSAYCDLSLAEKGYTMSTTVTNEQASKLRVGDEATITNYWYGDTPSAVITSIKTDPSSRGQAKIVTLSVTGADLYNGQNLYFTIGEKGRSYENCVPNSAVREDNNGTFVLVVTSKSTPLGNRYTATRLDVTVIASDDTKSAISAAESFDYVITSSSLPISSGVQVRLSETK